MLEDKRCKALLGHNVHSMYRKHGWVYAQEPVLSALQKPMVEAVSSSSSLSFNLDLSLSLSPSLSAYLFVNLAAFQKIERKLLGEWGYSACLPCRCPDLKGRYDAFGKIKPWKPFNPEQPLRAIALLGKGTTMSSSFRTGPEERDRPAL